MKRIAIIGCGGSGKTALATQLGGEARVAGASSGPALLARGLAGDAAPVSTFQQDDRSACDREPARGYRAFMDIIDAIVGGSRLVFVGAHPDDEVLIGPLLPFAASRSSAAVISVTNGQGGWNLAGNLAPRCLGEVRAAEFERACAVTGATGWLLGCTNGISTAHPEGVAVAEDEQAADRRWNAKGEWTPTPGEVVERWVRERPGLVEEIRHRIASLAPCVVVSFEKDHGFTGHAEHRAVALVMADVFAGLAGVTPAKVPATLHHVIFPNHARPDDVHVTVKRLDKIGRRDHLAIAMAAVSCYESQFGLRDSEQSARYLPSFVTLLQTMIFRPAAGTIDVPAAPGS